MGSNFKNNKQNKHSIKVYAYEPSDLQERLCSYVLCFRKQRKILVFYFVRVKNTKVKEIIKSIKFGWVIFGARDNGEVTMLL